MKRLLVMMVLALMMSSSISYGDGFFDRLKENWLSGNGDSDKEAPDKKPDPPATGKVGSRKSMSHKAGDRMVKTVNGVEFAFRWCPAGTFLMGSPEDEEGHSYDETQHEVTLTKGFWMLETEVTQKQWKAVMGENPSGFKGDDLPVEQVSWNDCQEFCKKCTKLGLPVCLPTEAQWEYACRAGTTGPYAGNLDAMAWYGFFSEPKGPNKETTTHSVGTKKANAWGLYDMHGNVLEWCEDRYTEEHYGDDATDPVGPSNGSDRVMRGGSWDYCVQYCRSASRDFSSPEYRVVYLGFRVVLKGQ